MPMSPGSKIVIAGGSGFLGISLATHLASQGRIVTILSRRAPAATGHRKHIAWDARTLGQWTSCLDGADGLVNLVGRSVNCVKTPDHCDEILRSRVESTRILGEACRVVAAAPPVWVQMSTAHIYGDPPVARCDEQSPFGYGLAPDVGRAWESEFATAALPSQRRVVLRTSFVVGRKNIGGAGALGTLARLAKFGLGGRVASGTQGMSWIHELDMNRIFERALGDANMNGAYIASSPNPVPQREFMCELRRHAGGFGKIGIALPSTSSMVRIVTPLLMRTDPELAIYGRYVIPRRLMDEAFEFRFPTLDRALADLFTKPK